MHSAFLQDPLHLAGISFGCCRRQSFTNIHLTKDHCSLLFYLLIGDAQQFNHTQTKTHAPRDDNK